MPRLGSPPDLVALVNPVRAYAWGSHHAIAQLQGRPTPTDEPEAELWIGAHASDPSTTEDGTALTELVAAAPEAVLGPRVASRFDGQLPFLLKVLGIAAPLSLQAHPDVEQAATGHAEEEQRGVAVDDPTRTFRDDWSKPELLVALTPVTALCGLRPAADSVDLLTALDLGRLQPVAEQLRRDGDAALPAVLRTLLTWPDDDRASLVAAIVAAAEAIAGQDPLRARWLERLGQRYPADPGVAVTLLLHLVELAPGQAIHVRAGELHAYLDGTAIEVAACSDNVVRGGLTDKHVDVAGLLSLLSGQSSSVPTVDAVGGVDGEVVYPAPVPHFRLSRLTLDRGRAMLDDRDVEVLLVTDGEVTMVAGRDERRLTAGAAVLVPARAGGITLAGTGTVFRATVGDEVLVGHG